MRKIMKGLTTFMLMLFVVCFVVVTNTAAEEMENKIGADPVADVTVGPHGVTFQPKVGYAELVLTVSTPNGTVIRKVFTSGVTPSFELSGNEGDGSFTYELRVVPRLNKQSRSNESGAGLEISRTRSEEPMVQSGYFSVDRGRFVTPSDQGEMIGIAQPLDQQILDDLIVDGSICVGQDCTNGESFGFDTLRLKENNLRIKFQDTSNSASFPSNDWQLTANDSSNGGANKFSIDDIDGGRTPFTLEAGAPSHSLYVDDGGRVGLGTSTPVVELHVVDGDTPTLRLEQDGSSGFTPQTWDLAGNETNFFVRDVTNGSKLPFKIRPGATTGSLDIKADGSVTLLGSDNNLGIGTASPGQAIYIARNNGTDPTIMIEKTDGTNGEVKGQFSVRGSKVMLGSRSDHQLNLSVNNSPKVIISTDGYVGIGQAPTNPIDTSVAIANGAYLDTNGVWQQGSSKTFKKNITAITSGEALDTLAELNPVKYNYIKDEDQEEYAGFLAEDVPELVASKNRKTLNAMDVVAVLTKVVQQQQKSMEDQRKTIDELKNRITELEKK